MRGTLHFVAAEDVRWMLALLTPRVVAASAARLRREFGLDARVLGRCADAATRALEGGRRLTRAGLYGTLDRARITTAGGRGLQIVSALAHQGVICYGPRDGKHHTVVLLDEWLPPATAMDREEALAELARRYFTSHGPATVSDFAWWSGLLVRDAQRGLDAARRSLVAVEREGRAWWAAPGSAPRRAGSSLPAARLRRVHRRVQGPLGPGGAGPRARSGGDGPPPPRHRGERTGGGILEPHGR